MAEIEDRGVLYKSYKSYAKALASEVRKLQQMLPGEKVNKAYEAVRKEIRSGRIPAIILEEED